MDARPVTLSVVIPAYNEAQRIGKTLRLADEYLNRQPYNFEVLVVDDGSRDNTAEVVRKHAVQAKNVKLFRLERNRGKGWAVRTGMLQATGRYRLFMDADGSTSIEQWERMNALLTDGADVVVGSRHVPGSEIRVPQAPHREVLGYIFRQLVSIIFWMPVADTQNGFKAFRAEAAERIFKRQRIAGWAFDVEILQIARRLDYAMVEVPISWVDDVRSRMTFRAMPRMLLDLLHVRLRKVQPYRPFKLVDGQQFVRQS